MDMLCKNCQEPYDWYFLREEILIAGGMDMYEPAKKDGFHNLHFHFTPGPVLQSCPACRGARQDARTREKGDLLSAIADVLGDDVDGYMAMVEDAEYMGLLDE